VIKILIGKLYLKSIRYRNAIEIFGPDDKLQIMYEDGSGLTWIFFFYKKYIHARIATPFQYILPLY
jgi:hypothetical protein